MHQLHLPNGTLLLFSRKAICARISASSFFEEFNIGRAIPSIFVFSLLETFVLLLDAVAIVIRNCRSRIIEYPESQTHCSGHNIARFL